MTITQKQYILAALGYYTGQVDGIWGTQSEAATRQLQERESVAVDGVFGDKTLNAALNALAAGRFAPELTEEPDAPQAADSMDIPAWWAEIKHFTREEFRCPCGKWCNGYPVEPSEKLVRFMDAMRGDFGTAVIVVPPDGHSGGSGVRCQTYNDSLKSSVPNSYHTLGKAADFSAPGVSAYTIESYLAKALSAGKIRYWYCISSGNYHVDVA